MKAPFCLLICLLVTTQVFPQSVNFDYPRFITNEDGYLVSFNEYSAPCFGDWDDDGDLDMMVGVYHDGQILYYKNISSGIEPEYASLDTLTADGVPIQVTYG